MPFRFSNLGFGRLVIGFNDGSDYPIADPDRTPIAKHIGERVLTLPMYADLGLEDVDRICEIIIK